MSRADLPFRPLIIIGAGRSGTNILRGALCTLPGFATWPCDELNPIMRHCSIGLPRYRCDAMQKRPAGARFICGAFRRWWERQVGPAFLVEKTRANILRVPFIARILLKAQFVFLHRQAVMCSPRRASAGADAGWPSGARGQLGADEPGNARSAARRESQPDLRPATDQFFNIRPGSYHNARLGPQRVHGLAYAFLGTQPAEA